MQQNPPGSGGSDLFDAVETVPMPFAHMFFAQASMYRVAVICASLVEKKFFII